MSAGLTTCCFMQQAPASGCSFLKSFYRFHILASTAQAAEQTRCQQGLAYSWLECRHTHRWRTSRELGRAVPSGRPQRGDVELRWARGFTPSHCLCVGTVGRGKFAVKDLSTLRSNG